MRLIFTSAHATEYLPDRMCGSGNINKQNNRRALELLARQAQTSGSDAINWGSLLGDGLHVVEGLFE